MRSTAISRVITAALIIIGFTYALNPERNLREHTIDFFNTVDGLPQNSVLAIAQTPDGYLWLGTYEGLARFDGLAFTIFDNSNTPELINISIKQLLRDSKGRLWIGTPNGLLCYKNGKFRLFGEKDGLKSEFILSIYEDALHRIWIGTTNGIALFEEDKFKIFTVEDGLPDNHINSISGNEKGEIWIGTANKGLSFYNNKGFFNYDMKSGLTSLDIRALLYDSTNQNLWIGTGGGGLILFRQGQMTKIAPLRKHRKLDIRALYIDSHDMLWVGTNGNGLFKYKDNTFQGMSQNSDYANLRIRDFHEDHEGSMWIGTRKGLMRLKDDFFIVYNSQNGLPVNSVRSVFEDRDGRIWFGTVGGGATMYDGKKFRTYNTANGLSNNRVWTIDQDKNGSIWLGTYGGGVHKITGERITHFSSKNGLANDVIRVVYCDSRNRIWIGTNGGGINIIDGSKITHIGKKDGLSDNFVYSIKEDKNGDIWIGTYSGELNRYRDGEINVFLPPKNDSKSAIWAIYPDDEGNIWLGTDHGGLIRLRDGKYTRYKISDGLYHDQAFQILEDKSGFLWMNCNKGIYSIKKKDLDAYDRGEIQKLFCDSYGKDEGIIITETSGPAQPAGWLGKDGRLWFSTMEGAVVFDRESYKPNDVPPPISIESLHHGKTIYKMLDSLILKPGQKNLEIHYTAMSFLIPKKILFKYKLGGYDSEWVDAGNRRVAFYTGLGPGEYSFKVIAANNNGVWNNEGREIHFTIEPFFYETNWFKALVFILVLLFVSLIYWIRISQIKRQQVHLEEEVNTRTVQLNTANLELKKTNKELNKSNRVLEYLAQYDALTKIPNRRHFVEVYEQQWRLSFREKQTISIIIIDIDLFKFYNDHYGHLEGDTCLKTVAATLKASLKRPTDFIARYGGEEFVVVLPRTDEKGGLKIAKLLCKKILDKKIPHAYSSVSKYLTISLGVSSCQPKDDKSMNVLLKKADEALYVAKENGKNRADYLPLDDD